MNGKLHGEWVGQHFYHRGGESEPHRTSWSRQKPRSPCPWDSWGEHHPMAPRRRTTMAEQEEVRPVDGCVEMTFRLQQRGLDHFPTTPNDTSLWLPGCSWEEVCSPHEGSQGFPLSWSLALILFFFITYLPTLLPSTRQYTTSLQNSLLGTAVLLVCGDA